MPTFYEILQDLRQKMREVDPQEVSSSQKANSSVIILDVREKEEWQEGHVPGVLHIPRGFLELEVEELLPDKTTPIICQCAGGIRSLFAAKTLRDMGYEDVSSMSGGFKAWKEAGLPFEVPQVFSSVERTRYGRHIRIPEVGEKGQRQMLDSKVLIIGAGGLGSAAAYYLAAAGVGTIGIVDFDVVDASNLQRQILHTTDRIGQPKVESAKASLLALNPGIRVETHAVKLTSDNVEKILKPYDIVIDGSDNFPTRYLVNDACVLLQKPNIHGSVQRFAGQVTIFYPRRHGSHQGPCYRCLYPEPPPPELAPSCAEAGVLGILPGVMGLLQAVETLKLILDQGQPLIGRLLCYDALRAQFSELKLRPDPECSYCAPGKKFPGFVDYEQFCASR